MFGFGFNGTVSHVNQEFEGKHLKKFASTIENKFSKLAGWGSDHNMMLKSFIEERFLLHKKSLKKGQNRFMRFLVGLVGIRNPVKKIHKSWITFRERRIIGSKLHGRGERAKNGDQFWDQFWAAQNEPRCRPKPSQDRFLTENLHFQKP